MTGIFPSPRDLVPVGQSALELLQVGGHLDILKKKLYRHTQTAVSHCSTNCKNAGKTQTVSVAKRFY